MSKSLFTKIGLTLVFPLIYVLSKLYYAYTGIKYDVADNPIEELTRIWRN